MSSEAPHSLTCNFSIGSTRGQQKIIIPKPSNDVFKSSLTYTVAFQEFTSTDIDFSFKEYAKKTKQKQKKNKQTTRMVIIFIYGPEIINHPLTFIMIYALMICPMNGVFALLCFVLFFIGEGGGGGVVDHIPK